MNGAHASDPLWARGLHAKALESKPDTFGTSALLALQAKLRAAGRDLHLATIRNWPHHIKGAAYLWAVAWLEGREDCPPPFDEEGRPVG